MRASTFLRRRSADSVPVSSGLPGTKPSLKNASVRLVSTGNTDLDGILLGGIPMGSIVLVREDEMTKHAHVLLRLFVAEGLSCGHRVLLASADHDTASMARRLPFNASMDAPGGGDPSADPGTGSSGGVAMPAGGVGSGRPGSPARASSPTIHENEPGDDLHEENPGTGADDGLHVAWRYRRYLQRRASSGAAMKMRRAIGGVYGHSLDLSRAIQPELLSTLEMVDVGDDAPDEHGSAGVYIALRKALGHFCTGSLMGSIDEDDDDMLGVLEGATVRRVAIHSFASPLWGPAGDKTIVRFVHSLRGLARARKCTVLLTMPAHLHDARTVAGVEALSDVVLSVESFEDAGLGGKEHEFSEYSGMLRVRRMYSVGTLSPLTTSSNVYVYRVGGKRLEVDTMHLPPEGEKASRFASAGKCARQRVDF